MGFSARDLMETHARFWDIHILGPNRIIDFERQQRLYHEPVRDPQQKIPETSYSGPYTGSEFDAAMTTGSYSEPYRRALELWGSTVSVVMFPMAAFFAFQTPNPIKVYKRIEQIIRAEVKINRGISIHEEWRKYFFDMREACNRISLEETGSYLVPGADVLNRASWIGPGADQNSVYWLYRLVAWQMTEGMGPSVVDQHFCFPGDPGISRQINRLRSPSAGYNVRWPMGA
jgi:hypothetical protein